MVRDFVLSEYDRIFQSALDQAVGVRGGELGDSGEFLHAMKTWIEDIESLIEEHEAACRTKPGSSSNGG